MFFLYNQVETSGFVIDIFVLGVFVQCVLEPLVYFGESESAFVMDEIYFESLLFSLNWNRKCNVGRDAYDIFL